MAKIDNKEEKLSDGTIITLRSPEESDAESFIEYNRNIFSNSAYLVTEADEYEIDIDRQRKWIKNFEGKVGAISIIAEHQGKIIGNVDFRNREGRRRIEHRGAFGMGVIKAYRGRGAGKVLVARLIEWARREDNPIEKIELTVLAENKPAIRLYEKMGFVSEGRIVKEVKMPDGRYIDGISMGLWL